MQSAGTAMIISCPANKSEFESAEEMSAFVAALSHDLKEPLRTVTCLTELISQSAKLAGDSEATSHLTRIRNAAQRMRALIDDALLFVLADGGSDRSEVDIGEVLRFATANLETAIEDAGVTITNDPLPVVRANFGALARVFQNLISNAIKYHSQLPLQIHVGCEGGDPKNGWIFSVADNGMGIDSKYGEQIFEPLKRLHGQQDYPGTGLGLAICRRIVELHGGEIWLKSEERQGSTFYFSLPSLARILQAP